MIIKEKNPDILYEDEDIVVINKPAYFPVQSAKAGKKDCCSFLKNHLSESLKIADPYLGVIHRLDEPVEGILVFAKSKKAAAVLSDQIQNGRFKKSYTAAVRSKEPLKNGVKSKLTDWIKKEKTGNLSGIVKEGTPGAGKAELIYEVRERLSVSGIKEGYVLNIELLTGRHHQIRLQLKNAGLPIIGDRKYGTEEDRDGVLCLCAHRLVFTHPVNGKEMSFKTEPAFLEGLRRSL